MYVPTASRRTRDGLRAGSRARTEAIAAFWKKFNPFA